MIAAGWRSRIARGAVIAAAAGLFLAHSAAFHSDQLPFAIRCLYWIGLLELGTMFNLGLQLWGDRSRLATERPAALAIVSIAASTLVLTPLVVVVTDRMMAGGGGGLGHIAYVGFAVLTISVVLTVVNTLAERQPLTTHGPAAEDPAIAVSPQPMPTKFLDRLPPKLRGGELYAVEAEDHYLRLHTSRGSDLILLRLSDALAELEGIEGAQTHRSWWVAKAAVEQAERADGRTALALKSGAVAPVSRTYVKALRESGWF